jgi:hypothetical protein
MAPAKSAKAKPKPKSQFTDKKQSERFIEAAQERGVEDTSTFDDNFERIVDQKTRQSSN